MKSPAPGHATKSEFADKHLHVARSYVTALGKAGRLVLDDNGHVNVEASLARIRDTSGAPERAAEPGEKFADARDKKEHYLAETARLDFEERCSRLMQAERVVQAVANAGNLVRTALEDLAAQVAPQLPVPREAQEQCRVLITERVEVMLNDLAQRFNAAAIGAQT